MYQNNTIRYNIGVRVKTFYSYPYNFRRICKTATCSLHPPSLIQRKEGPENEEDNFHASPSRKSKFLCTGYPASYTTFHLFIHSFIHSFYLASLWLTAFSNNGVVVTHAYGLYLSQTFLSFHDFGDRKSTLKCV